MYPICRSSTEPPNDAGAATERASGLYSLSGRGMRKTGRSARWPLAGTAPRTAIAYYLRRFFCGHQTETEKPPSRQTEAYGTIDTQATATVDTPPESTQETKRKRKKGRKNS